MSRYFIFIWLIILLLSALFIATAEAASRFEVKQMVMREAVNSNVPVALALAVAKVESDFNAKALSSAGARGVMQIMPETAQLEFGVTPNRLWDANVNIRLGIQFLEQLHNQYEGRWDLALSHYNGGTVKGSTPHERTKKYIQSVQKWQRVYQEQASLWDDKPKPQNEEASTQLVELRNWQPRTNPTYDNETPSDLWRDEPSDENDYPPTRIIIVERENDNGWRRPPPPPPPRWNERRGDFRGFSRHHDHDGPPRRHFR